MKTRERKGDGPVVFTCDETGLVFKTGEQDFNAAWEKARARGWSAEVDRVRGGPWRHYSPQETKRRAASNEQASKSEAAQTRAPARKRPLVRGE